MICPPTEPHKSTQSACRACSKPHVQAMEAAKATAPLDTMQEAGRSSEGAWQLRRSPELPAAAPMNPPQSVNPSCGRPQRPRDASNAHFRAAAAGSADAPSPQSRIFGPPAVQHSHHASQKVCLTQRMITRRNRGLKVRVCLTAVRQLFTAGLTEDDLDCLPQISRHISAISAADDPAWSAA